MVVAAQPSSGRIASLGTMRIGVMGLGTIAGAHVAGWQALQAEGPIDLHGHDVRPEAPTPDGVQRHDDLDSLLAAVDLVDICTPTVSHVEVIKAAADAGRPVICEKPLALTVAEAVDAARYCRDRGVSLQVGQVVRYYPAYAAAHAAFATGAYGTPAVLRFKRAGAMPHQTWAVDEAISGGLVLDLMIHDLDQAIWFAGPVVRVHANLRTLDADGGRPHCYAILTHASGAITHVTSSWAMARGFETSFEIAGTEGMIDQSTNEAVALRIDRDDLAVPTVVDPATHPFALELRDLLLAATTGRRGRVTAADGIAALSCAVAVRESARTGLPQVPEPVPDDLVSPRTDDLAGADR